MRTLDRLRHRIIAGLKTIERRWYLALGTILTMLPLLFAASAATGVYYTKADVLFLGPALSVDGNALQADPAQTLTFASVVVHRLNGEEGNNAPRSTSAPLYGSGIRQGHLVYIPNSGGQWQMSYSRPVVTIEVVGESAEEVATQRDQIVKRISVLAETSQEERNIKPAIRITTELDPSAAFVAYVGVRNGRAQVALIFLTLGLAVGIPLLADRIMSSIRTATDSRRRTEPNTGPQGPMQKSVPPLQNETQMAPPII